MMSNCITISPLMIYLLDSLDTINSVLTVLLILLVVVFFTALLNYVNNEFALEMKATFISMMSRFEDVDDNIKYLIDNSKGLRAKKLLCDCNDNLLAISKLQNTIINNYQKSNERDLHILMWLALILVGLVFLKCIIPSTATGYDIYIHSFYSEVDPTELQSYFNNIKVLIEGIRH